MQLALKSEHLVAFRDTLLRAFATNTEFKFFTHGLNSLGAPLPRNLWSLNSTKTTILRPVFALPVSFTFDNSTDWNVRY